MQIANIKFTQNPIEFEKMIANSTPTLPELKFDGV